MNNQTPLPYWFIPKVLIFGNLSNDKLSECLQVTMPREVDEVRSEDPEWMIVKEEQYNDWVEWVQQQFFIGGWWEACSLPYRYDDGLIVETTMTEWGNWEAFLSRNIHYEEGFSPAIPVDGYSPKYYHLDQYGYHDLLFWARDFDEYEG